MKNFKQLFISLIFFGILFSNLFANDNLQNKIYKNLRCIVCQGQSIADSNSDFANTIKSVVNDKVKEGMNEKQIYNFLSQKYSRPSGAILTKMLGFVSNIMRESWF